MHAGHRLVALSLVAVLAAACGGDEKKTESGGGGGGAKKDGPAKPGGGGKFDAAKATGTLKGVVKTKGTAPAPKNLGIANSSDAFCKSCGDKQDPATKVNEGGTVPNVFIWASEGPHKGVTGFPTRDLVIDQVGCVYIPHVSAVMAGQEFTVKNSDQTTHNVKATPKRGGAINKNQPAGKSDKVKFENAEKAIKLQCEVHGWMSGYVFVLDHPYWGASKDGDGTFEIKDLYPGTYKFKYWHETWGKEDKEFTVEIKDGQTTEHVIELEVK
jgi:plastocyanin